MEVHYKMSVKNMVLRCVFAILVAQCIWLACGESATAPTITTSSTMESSEESNDKSRADFNASEAMMECNRTYHIEMDYLKELNDTGSFPDETEKIPMCFIKCYLESADILSSEGKVNKERAVSMLWKDAGDSVDECIQEMS